MRMLGNKVAIQSLAKSIEKKGLLQMPEDSFNTGKVKFIGPDCKGLELGQVVCFGSQRETVKVNGEEFIIMESDNIYGILNGEEV